MIIFSLNTYAIGMNRIFLASLVCLLAIGCSPDSKFTLVDPSDSGVEFVNELILGDTLNILDNEFVYNGAGVAVGDFNLDGLQDLFFTGNQVDNRLYLNKGDFEFQDVTRLSGIAKEKNQWSAGVTTLDINRDGLLDIYISNTMSPIREKRTNLLFINTGNDANGIPHFKNETAAYGLEGKVHDSAAAFFDYDNDGDLDVFLAVNYMDTKYPNQFITRTTDGSGANTDVLLVNEWSDSLQHPVFRDVSKQAGIGRDGYSHSVMINDFNRDGWQDIYVCNDYLSNDILYINNQDGTFRDEISSVFKHESLSSMGSDLADINNDGWEDLFITEMMPVDNKRKKLFLGANNYTNYVFTEQYKYEYQYVRNTLQLNRGAQPDSDLPVFSDIAFFSNVQETDWSWSPLMADLDNDGYRDILVTNGFPRDVTDHDFGAFRSSNASTLMSKTQLYLMIPEVKVPNAAFRNRGDLTFENVTENWGFGRPSFTNGSAYVDLDNDGDLDIVTNNINDYAFIYRNNDKKGENHFLRVQLKGSDLNPDAFGSEVRMYEGGKFKIAKMVSGRGYLSQSENIAHFGLGKATQIDSVVVVFPDGVRVSMTKPSFDQLVTIKYEKHPVSPVKEKPNSNGLMQAVEPASIGLDFFPDETDFIDYNFQRTLPHKFSQYGPGVAVGDVNGDGLDDVVFGGSARFDEAIYIQQPSGKFQGKKVSFKPNYNKKEEDLGILLFDADGDHDNDLYLARGSYQHEAGSIFYQHLLCINDGKGNYRIDSLSLGKLRTCGSAVKAADYDLDGDLDLFVGGRVLPRAYPKPDRTFLLRNDSKQKDAPQFTDVTSEVAPELANVGLVSDALWTDFNSDQRPDLILACEWMPILFFENNGKGFINVTANSGVAENKGWWTSLAGADIDNDGDTDYIAGNLGLNTYFKCSSQEPLTIYAKDFDGNGLYDPFISCYWRDSTGSNHEYFYHTRDDMIKQLVMIRTKFQTYGQFGAATVDKVFTPEELEGAQIMKANYMSSSVLINLGSGKFQMNPLPMEAQMAPLYGILPRDLNQDGNIDLLVVGNDYGLETLQGRADALYGLAMVNKGDRKFEALTTRQSAFFVPGDARALTTIEVGKRELILATQNRDSLRLFYQPEQKANSISLQVGETTALIEYQDGKKQRKEFYWGSTFLSQETRTFFLNPSMKEVQLFDRTGKLTRTVKYE